MINCDIRLYIWLTEYRYYLNKSRCVTGGIRVISAWLDPAPRVPRVNVFAVIPNCSQVSYYSAKKKQWKKYKAEQIKVKKCESWKISHWKIWNVIFSAWYNGFFFSSNQEAFSCVISLISMRVLQLLVGSTRDMDTTHTKNLILMRMIRGLRLENITRKLTERSVLCTTVFFSFLICCFVVLLTTVVVWVALIALATLGVLVTLFVLDQGRLGCSYCPGNPGCLGYPLCLGPGLSWLLLLPWQPWVSWLPFSW